MEPLLLLFLIVIGNLTIYWVFFGQKRFEQKVKGDEGDGGEILSN
jgi:hypothetical protein